MKLLENMFLPSLSSIVEGLYSSIPRVPEYLFHRRNWVPHPLPRQRVCLPPWIQKGGGKHSLAGEGGGGTQFGRLDRKPGTEYSVGSTVQRKMLSSVKQDNSLLGHHACIVYDFSFLRIQLGDIHTF
jgi:hypothetical protein